jgi:glycosyltransferase involved in cell wall biosynthesis
MTPWLSVLMPVYNGGRYLRAALDSLVAQQAPGFEVIAVDDGSLDNSLAILQSYAHRLPLRVLEQPPSGNWVRATNAALAEARGEFVSMLHQDDFWLPGRYAKLRALTATHPTVDFLLHAAQFVDVNGRTVGRWRAPLACGLNAADEVHCRLLVQNFIAIPSPTVRRSHIDEVGGLDERLWYTADWDFWLKLTRSTPVAYADVPLTAFRIHGDSQTMRRSTDGDAFRRQLLDAYEPHAVRWLAVHPEDTIVDRVARFSIDVNTALAKLSHGRRAGLLWLGGRFLALGPRGWHRYFRDSQIVERVAARLRLKMLDCPRR